MLTTTYSLKNTSLVFPLEFCNKLNQVYVQSLYIIQKKKKTQKKGKSSISDCNLTT